MDQRVQHVVLFNFPEELSLEEEQWMFEQVKAWPQSIAGFTGLRVGKDVGERNAGYSYLLLTEFENEDAHQTYYSQPAHVAFSEWVASKGADVIRVDYPLTPDTLVV